MRKFILSILILFSFNISAHQQVDLYLLDLTVCSFADTELLLLQGSHLLGTATVLERERIEKLKDVIEEREKILDEIVTPEELVKEVQNSNRILGGDFGLLQCLMREKDAKITIDIPSIGKWEIRHVD